MALETKAIARVNGLSEQFAGSLSPIGVLEYLAATDLEARALVLTQAVADGAIVEADLSLLQQEVRRRLELGPPDEALQTAASAIAQWLATTRPNE